MGGLLTRPDAVNPPASEPSSAQAAAGNVAKGTTATANGDDSPGNSERTPGMVATRTRQARHERKAAEVTGNVTCETLHDGRYTVVSATTYRGEQQRTMAIANAIDWAAQNGERRAVNNYRNADQRQRHEQVYPAPLPPDGEWEYEEHDAAALAQFLRDETGLAWRVGGEQRHYSEMAPQHVQGVDYW